MNQFVFASYRHTFKNNDGYQFGDEYIVNGGFNLVTLPWLVFTAQVNYRYMTHDSLSASIGSGPILDRGIPNTGSSWFGAAPGVLFNIGDTWQAYFYAQVPLYRDANNNLAQATSYTFGVTKYFQLFTPGLEESGAIRAVYFHLSTRGVMIQNIRSRRRRPVPGRDRPALCAGLLLGLLPMTPVAFAETALPWELGPKITTEHKVKSLVGPSMQIDEAGSLSLAWMEENKEVRSVLYARSTEPGGPMGAPVRINRAEDIPYWRQEAPALVVQGDDVFVTWGLAHPKATPEQPFATELRLSRSNDGGRTFQPSILVNDDPGVIQHTFDALHRDAEGRFHFSWIDGREGKKDPGTYVARSLDQGKTVTSNRKVDEGTCVCCRTAITSGPDGTVYVAWRKILRGTCGRPSSLVPPTTAKHSSHRSLSAMINGSFRPARIGRPPWASTGMDGCMWSGIRKGPTKFPPSIWPFQMTGAGRFPRSGS